MVRRWICAALLIGGLLAAIASSEAGSQETAVEGKASSPAVDDEEARAAKLAAMNEARVEALGVLERSSQFLAAQKQFRARAATGFEVLQGTGQLLEFGGERTATVRRPDRLHFEGRNRNGEARVMMFDGTNLTMVFPNQKAYASVKRPGDLDQALDYVIDELDAPLAMADLLYTDFYSNVAPKVEFGVVVGDSEIGGRLCDHLAFASEDLGIQIWVEKGERPLPVRIVLTYQKEAGKPRFWAQFLEWDLASKFPDDLFAYSPAEGYERLPVRVIDAADTAEEK